MLAIVSLVVATVVPTKPGSGGTGVSPRCYTQVLVRFPDKSQLEGHSWPFLLVRPGIYAGLLNDKVPLAPSPVYGAYLASALATSASYQLDH
jgi:hypothetical protein